MPTGAAFEIFDTGYYVYWYGILIATAVALGVVIAMKRRKRYGWTSDELLDFALWAIPIAVVCARLYYVAFEWDRYKDDLIGILEIWNGGLAIYGAVIGGVVTALVFCKVRKKSFLNLADCVAPALVLGQAIGRWGNFFNQEAFGMEVTNPAHMWFPLAVKIEETGTIHYATFFYESLWCFLIFLFLLAMSKKFRHRGDCMLWYFLLYGVERAFVEGLRTDSLYIGDTGIRVSQLLSALLAVAIAAFLICRTVWEKRHKRPLYGPPFFKEQELAAEAQRAGVAAAVAAAMGAGEAPESLAPEICAAPEEAGGAAAAPAEETAAEPGQGQTAPARDTETPQD